MFNNAIRCPYGVHPAHETADRIFWIRSRNALKRHLAVHHQIILRNIIQQDNSGLDMLIRPTEQQLRSEINKYWRPRRDQDGNYYPHPSVIPGELPVDPRPTPVPLMSLNTRPCPIMSVHTRPPPLYRPVHPRSPPPVPTLQKTSSLPPCG